MGLFVCHLIPVVLGGYVKNFAIIAAPIIAQIAILSVQTSIRDHTFRFFG